MSHIGELLAERARSPLRLRFSGQIESEYRNALRRNLRYPRSLLFAVIAIGFATSPLQELSLFNAPDELRGVLTLIALLVAPITFAAALVSFFTSIPRAFCSRRAVGRRSDHLLGRLRFAASWADQRFALPSLDARHCHFCSGHFRQLQRLPHAATDGAVLRFWHRTRLYYLNEQSVSQLPAYSLFYLFLISVLGSYTNETLRRQSWIQGKSASILARSDVLTGLANRGAFNYR